MMQREPLILTIDYKIRKVMSWSIIAKYLAWELVDVAADNLKTMHNLGPEWDCEESTIEIVGCGEEAVFRVTCPFYKETP